MGAALRGPRTEPEGNWPPTGLPFSGRVLPHLSMCTVFTKGRGEERRKRNSFYWSLQHRVCGRCCFHEVISFHAVMLGEEAAGLEGISFATRVGAGGQQQHLGAGGQDRILGSPRPSTESVCILTRFPGNLYLHKV